MANYERGVYEPSDEVRIYDGSEEDEEAEGSRLPLLIVLAMIVIGAFAGVVYFAYSQGVARGRGETPVLAAAAGPDKVAPQTPGGSTVPYQGFKIYEQPAPSDDQADATPAAPQAAQDSTAPEAKPAPAQAETKPASPPPAKPMAEPAKPVAAPPAPKLAEAKPVQKPAAAPQVATGAPRALGAPAAAPPAAPAAAATAPASTGAYVLQIGAYKSQAEADAAWKTYQSRHAALLSGFSPNTQQADLGAKGTWYRLRIAGFASKDGAIALCARLKADGGACFLGK